MFYYIESKKTASMEDINTLVLGKKKIEYLRSKDKAK